MARLTAVGERPSLRPAPARLPSSSAATKTFMASMRSIGCSASCNTECRTIGIQSDHARIRTFRPSRPEESLARYRPNKALHLGLVVVVVHAGVVGPLVPISRIAPTYCSPQRLLRVDSGPSPRGIGVNRVAPTPDLGRSLTPRPTADLHRRYPRMVGAGEADLQTSSPTQPRRYEARGRIFL